MAAQGLKYFRLKLYLLIRLRSAKSVSIICILKVAIDILQRSVEQSSPS